MATSCRRRSDMATICAATGCRATQNDPGVIARRGARCVVFSPRAALLYWPARAASAARHPGSARGAPMLQKVKPAVQLKDMSLFRQQCYIDGQWVDADDKSTFAVYNPADGQQIGTVPSM